MKRSLRSWLWRVPLDQEFDEEIALHIEMRTRELVDERHGSGRGARAGDQEDGRRRNASSGHVWTWVESEIGR